MLSCLALSALAFANAVAGEAPQLAQQVAAGKLPPLEERLPKSPVVVKPVERVGEYGGQWRAAMVGGGDQAYMSRTIGYENLVRWNPENSAIIPNVAETFEVNESSTEFTFKLREGMKWSDGQPFTADDILFWYEAVLSNKELMPSPPAWMTVGGETGVVSKVDDLTVKFTFAKPHGLFLQWLSSWRGDAPVLFAKHFFSKFHPDYNPNVDALVKEAGLNNWVALFQSKGGSAADSVSHWQTTEAPRLYAWTLTQPFGFGTRVVAERNPYYWKVDTEGNQLPYLDRVTYEIVENPEVLLAKVIGGEIDFMDRHVFNSTNKSVMAEYREQAKYHFIEEVFTKMNTAIISLNLTNQDPVKREIFRNKDFRIGLSHAIDRQEIIDIVFIGQGEPWQAAPPRETPFFNERLAKQYIEYNVDLANEYLDKAYPNKDGEGFRLGPDGKRISFTIELPAAFIPELVDVAEIVQRHWRAVGVDMQINAIDRSLYHTRELSNLQDGAMWWGDGGIDAIMDPRFYFPYNNFSSYAPAWAGWFDPSGATNSVEGSKVKIEEPPESTRKQMDLYLQIKNSADVKKQFELLGQILDIAADEFYVIGISTLAEGYGIVKNDFHNVPARMIQGGAYYLTPAPTNPSQYFWDKK